MLFRFFVKSVLRIRIRNGIRIRDEHPESYLRERRNNFFGVKNTQTLIFCIKYAFTPRFEGLIDYGSG